MNATKLRRRHSEVVLVVVSLFTGLLGPVVTGEASVPGRNGRIAFMTYDGGANIFSVEPDGSDMRKVTDVPDQYWIYGFEWSPDGREVVFGAGDDSELYTIDADGGHLRQLTHSDAWENSPTWSPDGKHIAFLRDVRDIDQIFIIRADGRGPGDRITNFKADAYDLEWSPAGDRLAFWKGSSLFTIKRDGTGTRRLVDHALPLDASWSPDGTKLVYGDFRESFQNPVWYRTCFLPIRPPFSGGVYVRCQADLYVVDAAGGSPQRLTSNEGVEGYPSWSPDGKEIAFLSDRMSRAFYLDVYVMNADGSDQKMIARTPAGSWYTSWQALQS